MRPTEDLVREHGDILAMIQVVREMVRRLEAGQAVDPDHVDKAVYFGDAGRVRNLQGDPDGARPDLPGRRAARLTAGA